jgi:hypothetical protein
LNQENIIISDVFVTNKNFELIRTLRIIFFIAHHLLCIWHVNKNVLVNCKFAFSTKEIWETFYANWQKILYAYIKENYETTWNKLQNDYYQDHFEMINYLKKTWIKFFVIKIIKFHINKIRHFFNVIIFRSKSAHRVLKHNLRFFMNDLKTMMNNIEILLMNQRKEFAMKLVTISC